MKAKNSKDITRGYGIFSLYLAACVIVAVFAYFCYLRTSVVEVKRIISKTGEYDAIHQYQTDITAHIDTLYYYSGLFNSNLNDDRLQNTVNRRKQEILSDIDKFSEHDMRLHRTLLNQLITFLNVKDSIRSLKNEEDMIKNELRKCIEENRQTTRTITVGGKEIK
ncbi:MAG: type VI secretion system transmembrane protein TssO [Prevotellaceae bacterium]|jgi:hypothetical protein|nr:type VI secretion system transmembrane protein TssO [Prevotellaceae bacterium]